MDRALGFTKNPLGIIGLLIALIYGLAVLVAGSSAKLSQMQRWIMIALVAVFPLAVFWRFYLLVTKRHSKLYAPGDWRDEKNFLTALSGREQLEQVRAEPRKVLIAEATEESGGKSVLPMASSKRKSIPWGCRRCRA